MAFHLPPRSIAIVVSDPKVGAYIYQAVIDQINKLSAKASDSIHPNVTVYARKPREASLQKQFDHDSEITWRLRSKIMFYPDTDITQVNLQSAKSWVFTNGLPLIHLPESKKLDSVVSLEDLSEGDRKNVRAWASAIVHSALDVKPEHVVKSAANRSARAENTRTAPAKIIHPDGLIAIHGGMGPESGNGALMYLSGKKAQNDFHGDILLYSAARTPNSAKDYIVQTHDQSHHHQSLIPNPLPRVNLHRERIASINPDVLWMACNTMHYFQPTLEKVAQAKTLHIIEEGLKTVPHNAKVLLLATQASVSSGIFKQALEHLGRKDIRLIYPAPDLQKKVDSAIEEHVLKGVGYDKAAGLLEDVVKHYERQLKDNGCVMAGCTEIQVALKQGNGKLWNYTKHNKEIWRDNLRRFFSTKPDLIVMNLSQNPAPVFTQYELPRLVEYCVIDNLKEAADKSIEMCESAKHARQAGSDVEPAAGKATQQR